MSDALSVDDCDSNRITPQVRLHRTNIITDMAGFSVAAALPVDAMDVAIRSALEWSLNAQAPEGFWEGNVDTNSCIEAQWLLAAHFLGVRLPDEDGVIRVLLQRQRPDGSWEVYPDAPLGDINSTVEVYAALRSRGFDPACEVLSRARAWILSHGGLRNVRVFTRYWLAMIGVWPWQAIPNLPPEIIRFPIWFPLNIYNFAQWARATFVPLAIISARRPVWPLPGGTKLEELFPSGRDTFDFSIQTDRTRLFSLQWWFLKIDRVLHAAQTRKLIPGRESSIRLCLEWSVRHQDADGSWGGIQPPWIYGLIALKNEGYALTHAVIERGLKALSTHWTFQRDGATHIQATESSVWDTLLTLLGMHEAGCRVTDSPAMQKAVCWLLDQQVRLPGDWSVTQKTVEPGGWAFERANIYYPDVDDTAVALLVLAKVRDTAGPLRERIDESIALAMGWTLAMQSSNGGWAAFDKDNNKEIICKLPFCNFGEALDPPSVDVTAHVVEAFGALGISARHPAARRALDFIRAEQEPDGSWFGRWGVNHIYGTAAVLPALEAIGEDMSQPYIRRAADWLISKQNHDGGWGESCASYMDPKWRGVGPSTPSQTAWALMSLLVVDGNDYLESLRRGVKYLCETQDELGTWKERHYTAAGFPGYGVGARTNLLASDLSEKLQQGNELSRGFMLNFNMYRHYFPLIALGRARARVWTED